jgi:hypothetical protein
MQSVSTGVNDCCPSTQWLSASARTVRSGAISVVTDAVRSRAFALLPMAHDSSGVGAIHRVSRDATGAEIGRDHALAKKRSLLRSRPQAERKLGWGW